MTEGSPYLEPKHGRLPSVETAHSPREEFHPQALPDSCGGSPARSSTSQRRSWQDLIETPLTSSGLHFLQTLPAEDPAPQGPGGGLSPEPRRQSTLPAQRSLLRDHYGPLPPPDGQRVRELWGAGEKPRSFTLPRDGDLYALLTPSAGTSACKDPHGYQAGLSRDRGEQEDRQHADSLQDLYRALERANLSPMGERRLSTKLEYKRSFVRRCNNQQLNDKLHRLQILQSSLKQDVQLPDTEPPSRY